MKLRLIPILLFLLFVTGMAVIQFGTVDLPDNDGFYHIKLAYLMRTESLKPDFTWLPLSILNVREFYDHHFLYHVLLTPFTLGDLRSGAKWSAVIFASLAFLVVWWLFERQRIRYAPVWALALLGISDAFLYRMSVTRAQSLSLALLVAAVAFLLENKTKHLAVLSFFFVWLYDAFPLILVLGVLHFIALYIRDQKIDLKPLLYISIGVIVGLMLNPYFPDNIVFSYRHMFPKLADATAVRVGNEWYPYETKTLLENSLPALVAFAGGIFALGLNPRKMDLRTTFSLLLALLFGLMLFEARRFVEYFPPFVLIFTTFAFAPLFTPEPDPVPSAFLPRKRLVPLIVLSVAVAASITVSVPRAREAVASSKPYTLYAGASAWLEANTPAGSRVFQTDWDDFPRLFFYNTHNTYLIGLDPTYMQIYNPELFALWIEITQGRVTNPAQIIALRFGSQYIHTDLKHESFLRVAAQDPLLKEVYRDADAVIFEVSLP
jgi:hypothetical protein